MQGLVHKSNVSDAADGGSLKQFQKGDKIKYLKVLKCDVATKLDLGMKPSLFEPGELVSGEDDEALGGSDDEDINDEGMVNKESIEEETHHESKDKTENVLDQEVPGSDDEVPPWLEITNEPLGSAAAVAQSFGFDGFGTSVKRNPDGGQESDVSDDTSERRATKRQRKESQPLPDSVPKEEKNDEGRWETNPSSTMDFERLLLTKGGASIVWIRYMAFHLRLSDL